MNPNHDLLVKAVSAITHGKCAFCEAKDQLAVHRFRPIGNALPLADRRDAHLFYLWLADAWQNLFPICPTCRPTEPIFPVDGARCNLPPPQQIVKYVTQGEGLWPKYPPDERHQLIDPSREKSFHGHFKPKLDGTLVALSPRAAVTLEAFDLNRQERQQQRAESYRANLSLLRRLLGDLPRTKLPQTARGSWNSLFDFGTMEFGGTWLLLLKRVAARIDLPAGPAARPARDQLNDAFWTLVKAADGRERLDRALTEIAREDPALRPVSPGRRRVHRVRAQLRDVQISNFKAIERMRLELPPDRIDEDSGAHLAPSIVVLGENATGKSSLLEAIALTLTTDEARRSLDLEWETLPLDPTQLGLDEGSSIAPTQVRLTFDSGQTATLSISGGEAIARSEFGTERVAAFAYGAFRRFSGEGAAATSDRHIRNLFEASPLANPEHWLKSLPPQTFDMVVRTLRELLSIEGDFDVIQRVGRSRQLRMVIPLTLPDGTIRYNRTPLQAVSSGYRSMLGMLCDILRGLLDEGPQEEFSTFESSRGVVLIDEIEAHLHPRWKVQVMTSLRRALPGMTFIVTTHDPLCLRGMGPKEVVVLQRVASSDAGVESGLPIAIEQMTNLPDAADLRLEQLLTSDFFQLFSTSDAAADRRMAHVGDLVRRRAEGEMLDGEDARVLEEFERDIASALPVGSSEVHRMVQEAVVLYLEKRRDASSATLSRLTEKAKADILAALETL